jgi:hypothetical protein
MRDFGARPRAVGLPLLCQSSAAIGGALTRRASGGLQHGLLELPALRGALDVAAGIRERVGTRRTARRQAGLADGAADLPSDGIEADAR